MPPSPSQGKPHFLLDPPSKFVRAGEAVAWGCPSDTMTSRSMAEYVGIPYRRIGWTLTRASAIGRPTLTSQQPEFQEFIRAFVEQQISDVPMAYLLVTARALSPGNVLELLSHSPRAPACCFSMRALDVMLGGWSANLRTEKEEAKPLVAGKPLDIVGGGHEAYFDSDPVTVMLASMVMNGYREASSFGTPMPMFRFRKFMQEKRLFAGELPGATLARLIEPKKRYLLGGYTSGTLRQVFAGILSQMQLEGAYPVDAVRYGHHTEDSFAA